ncbi:MAG: hypothetical protein ACHQFW_04115 [Chitinophagales bacterium]
MSSDTPSRKFNYFSDIIWYFIFIISGIVSSLLSKYGYENYLFFFSTGIWILMIPAVLFNTTVIALACTVTRISPRKWISYLLLNSFSYALLVAITIGSISILMEGAFLLGIFTAGIGAVMSCWLFKEFLIKTTFNFPLILCLGMVSFATYDAILWFREQRNYDRYINELFYNLLNSSIFLIWQPIVGAVIVCALQKRVNKELNNTE